MNASKARLRRAVSGLHLRDRTIVALIGLPMVSAGWNEDVQQSIKSRSNYFSRINKLEKTSFQVPGSNQSQETVINQKLLNAYEQITASMLEDAQRVTQVAMSRNQQSHDVLMPDLLRHPDGTSHGLRCGCMRS